MPFQEATNTQAYGKLGSLGLNGSGKTRTAAEIAIGLRNMLVKEQNMPKDQPVFFSDTETGSSFLVPIFQKAGIKLAVDRSRAFKSLITNMEEVAKLNGIHIIDSITHYWRELCETYAANKKYNKGQLVLGDWQVIKRIWSEFTDLYVNGPFHANMLGRQGYEYDIGEDEKGKKTVEKSGIKMKAETETGYEPNLLYVMERHQSIGNDGRIAEVWREAYILKDRCDLIDGKSFRDPTFKDFLPHFLALNLGGDHQGVDTSTNSQSMMPVDNSGGGMSEHRQCDILCEEIKELLVKHFPSKSAADHEAKSDLLAKHFKTRSWLNVESMGLMELKHGYNRLHNQLEGEPVFKDLPLDGEQVSGLEDQAKKTF